MYINMSIAKSWMKYLLDEEHLLLIMISVFINASKKNYPPLFSRLNFIQLKIKDKSKLLCVSSYDLIDQPISRSTVGDNTIKFSFLLDDFLDLFLFIFFLWNEPL